MTQKVNPSPDRKTDSFQTAGAIAYGGHGKSGFIKDGNNPTSISTQNSNIDETALNSFAETSSGTSLDITIDSGEAFVFGAWVCIDTATTVTLSASTSGQTVYVGWDKNSPDSVIIGRDSSFSSTSTDTDKKIPLFTFDTDSTGVTSVTDERSFDQIKVSSLEQGTGSGLDADTVDGKQETEIRPTVSDDGTSVTSPANTINFTGDIGATDTSPSGQVNVNLNNNSVTVAGNTVSLGDSVSVNYTDLNDSGNSFPIPNSDIASTSVSVAGNSVSLGGSTSVNHNDLSTISTDDHHSRYSDEEAQDAVGLIINGGTDLSANYDDTNDVITFSHNDTSSQANVTTDGATVIDDVSFDGRGHVTGVNTENRALDDWDNPTSYLDLDGNGINFDDPSNSSNAKGAVNIGYVDFQNEEWSDTPQNSSTLAYDASEGFMFNDNIELTGTINENTSL